MTRPIPLTDPDGVVHAYACGVCQHVHAGCSLFVVAEAGWNAQRSKESAKRCCMCSRCHEVVVPRGTAPGGWLEASDHCDRCYPIVVEEQEKSRKESEDKDARSRTAIEASLTVARDRNAAELLRHVMECISEILFCAGWIPDLEYTLWSRMHESDAVIVKGGAGGISLYDAQELRRLHRDCDGWWVWDDEHRLMFKSTEEWLVILEAHHAKEHGR